MTRRRVAVLVAVLVLLGVAAGGYALLRPSPSPPGKVLLPVWRGPRFSVAHPVGWQVHPLGDDEVTFERSRQFRGETWSDRLTVSRRDGVGPLPSSFESGGGMHESWARLRESVGHYQLVLYTEWETCGFCPEAEEVDQDLRALAAQIAPTLRDR